MAIKSFTRSTIENNIFYRSMLAGNTAYDPGSEFILAEEILTSSQTSVTFDVSSVTGYQHLQLRIAARTDRALHIDSAMMQLNSDTSTSYKTHFLYGSGTSVTSYAESTTNKFYAARTTGSTGGTSVFGAGVCDILDAFNSSKYTTTRLLTGLTTSSGSEIYLFSGLWMNTAPLTSLTLLPNIGSNFVSGSRFSLYGLKVA